MRVFTQKIPVHADRCDQREVSRAENLLDRASPLITAGLVSLDFKIGWISFIHMGAPHSLHMNPRPNPL